MAIPVSTMVGRQSTGMLAPSLMERCVLLVSPRTLQWTEKRLAFRCSAGLHERTAKRAASQVFKGTFLYCLFHYCARASVPSLGPSRLQIGNTSKPQLLTHGGLHLSFFLILPSDTCLLTSVGRVFATRNGSFSIRYIITLIN